MTTTVPTPIDLLQYVGKELGTSNWIEVPQSDVNLFAKATHDEQWIHVDPERAKDGPFGGAIAHGYLTLALLVPMMADILQVEKRSMGINYGLNKVRFPSPVPVGSRIRGTATLVSAEEIPGGVQIVVGFVVEREGGTKPVLIAEGVYRNYA
jgi:acyl dehydratase